MNPARDVLSNSNTMGKLETLQQLGLLAFAEIGLRNETRKIVTTDLVRVAASLYPKMCLLSRGEYIFLIQLYNFLSILIKVSTKCIVWLFIWFVGLFVYKSKAP